VGIHYVLDQTDKDSIPKGLGIYTKKEMWLCDKAILQVHSTIGQYPLTHDDAI